MGGTGTGSPVSVQTEAAYATYAEVVARVPRIFKTSGAPTQAEVNTWLAEGAMFIDVRLSNAGYGTPVASSVDAFALVRNLNATYGAAMVEQSRAVSPTATGETARGDILLTQFQKGLDGLLLTDLTALGVSYSSEMYCAGISESDKDTVEDDEDRLMTSFRRGQFAYPGAGTTQARKPSDEQERSD